MREQIGGPLGNRIGRWFRLQHSYHSTRFYIYIHNGEQVVHYNGPLTNHQPLVDDGVNTSIMLWSTLRLASPNYSQLSNTSTAHTLSLLRIQRYKQPPNRIIIEIYISLDSAKKSSVSFWEFHSCSDSINKVNSTCTDWILAIYSNCSWNKRE